MSQILVATAAFIVTIGLLVAIHEYGHLLAARALGVGVRRFSIGFGPTLWRRTSHRTHIEYQVAAIPLGGYVKMIDERQGEVAPFERDRAFNRAHPFRRIVILAAGPAVNVLFALFAYSLVFMMGTTAIKPIIAAPVSGSIAAEAGLQAQDRIVAIDGHRVHTWHGAEIALLDDSASGHTPYLTISRDGQQSSHVLAFKNKAPADLSDWGLRPFQPPSTPRLYRVIAGTPAAAAGLRTGDRILSINGQPLERPRELIRAIHAHPDETITLKIRRDTQIREIGIPLTHVDHPKGRSGGRLGAVIGGSPRAVAAMQTTHHDGPIEAVGAAWQRMSRITSLTASTLTGMVTGRVSLSKLGGPVSIAAAGGQIASLGVAAFIGFLALVSLSLALMNLLPLPVLDGGQIVLTSVEWIIRRPLPMIVQHTAQAAGMAGLFLLMAVALTNDIARVFM